MTLIWVAAAGDALAPLWCDYAQQAREKGTDNAETKNAKAKYDRAVAAAEASLARSNTPRTHALVVGVGHYKRQNLGALTTSVHGARRFTEWLLTEFHHPERPLGSVELLLSPGTLGDWVPGEQVAQWLSLVSGDTLPVKAATFEHITEAFSRWIIRSGQNPNNAAFWYFSGHGVRKRTPLVLPEDAALPSGTEFAANLIDIKLTQASLCKQQPQSQYFFIDACQEVPFDLLVNQDPNLGNALWGLTNGPDLQERECFAYLGSNTGRPAYGPVDEAPYFTQELLKCLKTRGAASHKEKGRWKVTSNSLRETLEAAGRCR